MSYAYITGLTLHRGHAANDVSLAGHLAHLDFDLKGALGELRGALRLLAVLSLSATKDL